MNKFDVENKVAFAEAFEQRFAEAVEHHFDTIDNLTLTIEHRIDGHRTGNFGITHALTTATGKRYVVASGIHGTVVFGEDGNVGVKGSYADDGSPVHTERFQNALVTLFIKGRPLVTLLDIIDHLLVDEEMPALVNNQTTTMEFSNQFLKLVELS